MRPALLCGVLFAARALAADTTPVLTFTRDLAAGEKVKAADLAPLDVATAFVSKSYVQPDMQQYVVGVELIVPVLKGDLARWTFFDTLKPELSAPCREGLRQKTPAKAQVLDARARVLQRHKK